MAIFQIYHITRYTYSAPVRESANQLKLYAIQDSTQRVLDHQLEITLNPQVETYFDFWGNRTGIFTITQYHQELKIASTKLVETFMPVYADADTDPEKHWEQLKLNRYEAAFFDFLFLEKFEFFPVISDFVKGLHHLSCFPMDIIRKMNDWIYKEFSYIKGITTIDTTLDEIWKLHAGVCQDFAHLLLAMLRMIKIPARYVSGYICPNKDGMRGEGATHAWVEAFLPFYGWVGIDPTNNCLVTDGHVKLAVGRNFADCTPVKGFFKGDAEQVMEVAVSVANEKQEKNEAIFESMQLQVAGTPVRSEKKQDSYSISQQQQ